MSRRSRSYSNSGSESPPRRARKRSRGSMSRDRDRSPYSPPPRGYRSPRNDYYCAAPSSSSKSGSYRALLIANIDSKVSDEEVKETLYKEFRRFGECSLRLVNEHDERVAYLTYKHSDDAHYARKNKPKILFYDKPIHVQPLMKPDYHHRSPSPRMSYDRFSRYSPPLPLPYNRDMRNPYMYPPVGYPLELPPYDPLLPPLHHGGPLLPPRMFGRERGRFPDFGGRRGSRRDRFPNYLQHVQPEDDPLACRTLFAGNLEVSITDEEVRRIFGRYGKLEDVDIKRPPPDTGNAYAFVRYENLDMAHQAKTSLSGQYIGKFMCKVGYGKPVPTVKVWVGGLGSWCNLPLLESEFDRFGAIKKVDYEPNATSALITYDSIDAAKAAVAEMRGFPLGGPGNRIRIDFAHVDGQSDPGRPPVPRSPREDFYEPRPPRFAFDPYDVPLRRDDYEPAPFRPRSPFEAPPPRDFDPVLRLEDIRVVAEVEHVTTPSWEGGIILKNSIFATKLHFVRGDKSTSMMLGGIMKIAQRLRLDPSKLDDVQRRLSLSPAHAIFIGLPTQNPAPAPPPEDVGAQDRPLKHLVGYLKQKDAAGVISLLSGKGVTTGVVYAFPPCRFSFDLLRTSFPNLIEDETKEDHIVIVMVTGPI